MASGLIGQAALLVSGILVARLLGPEERGYVALLVIFPSFLSIVGGLGIPEALTYFIASNPTAGRALGRSALRLGLVQALVLFAAHSLILVVVLRGYPVAVAIAGAISLLWVPAALTLQYSLAVVQGYRRFSQLNRLRLVAPILYSTAVVPIFLTGLADVRAIILAWVVSYIVAAGATLLSALQPLPVNDSERAVPSKRDMTRFGFKSFVGSTSPVETFGVDQAIVGLFLSVRDLGLYVAALAFANVPRLVGRSIGMVAYPHVASKDDPQEAERSIWRFFWLTTGLCGIIVGALGLGADRLVPLLFGRAFSESVPLVRLLLIGALFFGARRVLGDGLRGAGHPSANTVAEMCSWAWLIPSIALLAPRWGTEGVAVALTSSSAFGLAVLLFIAHRAFSGGSPASRDGSNGPAEEIAVGGSIVVKPGEIRAVRGTDGIPGSW